MQDFHRATLHRVNHNIRERSKRKFSRPGAVTGPAPIRKSFQRTDTPINCPHGRLCETRVVLLQVVLYIL